MAKNTDIMEDATEVRSFTVRLTGDELVKFEDLYWSRRIKPAVLIRELIVAAVADVTVEPLTTE